LVRVVSTAPSSGAQRPGQASISASRDDIHPDRDLQALMVGGSAMRLADTVLIHLRRGRLSVAIASASPRRPPWRQTRSGQRARVQRGGGTLRSTGLAPRCTYSARTISPWSWRCSYASLAEGSLTPTMTPAVVTARRPHRARRGRHVAPPATARVALQRPGGAARRLHRHRSRPAIGPGESAQARWLSRAELAR
jgi:hypothetical protein